MMLMERVPCAKGSQRPGRVLSHPIPTPLGCAPLPAAVHTDGFLPPGAPRGLWRKNTDTRYLPLSTLLCLFAFGYRPEFVSLERVVHTGEFYVFLYGFFL